MCIYTYTYMFYVCVCICMHKNFLLVCVLHSLPELLVLHNPHSRIQAEGAIPFGNIAELMPERKKGEGQTDLHWL